MTDVERTESLPEPHEVNPTRYELAVRAQVDVEWLSQWPDPELKLVSLMEQETEELMGEEDMFASVAFGLGEAFENPDLARKIKSELGDILWYATAINVIEQEGDISLGGLLDRTASRLSGEEMRGVSFDEFMDTAYEHRTGIDFWRGEFTDGAWRRAIEPDEFGRYFFAEPYREIMWLTNLLGRRLVDYWDGVSEDTMYPDEYERIWENIQATIVAIGNGEDVPKFEHTERNPILHNAYIEKLRQIPVDDILGNIVAMVAVITKGTTGLQLSEIAGYNLWKNSERAKRGTQFDKDARERDPVTGEKL